MCFQFSRSEIAWSWTLNVGEKPPCCFPECSFPLAAGRDVGARFFPALPTASWIWSAVSRSLALVVPGSWCRPCFQVSLSGRCQLSSFGYLPALVLFFGLNIVLNNVTKASLKPLLFFSLPSSVGLQACTTYMACSAIFRLGCLLLS